MEKLKNILDNLQILAETIIKYPKLAILVILIISTSTWLFVSRIGGIYDCYKVAWYEQGVPMENFEFKMLTEKCMIKRADGRWLPASRAVDVPDGLDE